MKTIIFAISIITFTQCAKLDHLKYLPPDSRPANKESFDQGLAAPTTGEQAHGSFGSGPESPINSIGESRSFEPQPTASGSFNAGSQNAARLQGSPFIATGPQSSSGRFSSSSPTSRPTQGYSAKQHASSEPQSAPATKPQYGVEPQKFNQPQGFSGSGEPKTTSFNGVQSSGPQATNRFPGSAFGNTIQSSQAGAGPQPTGQSHESYGAPDSQSNPSADIQGSTYGQSASPTFPGAPGSGAGIPHGSSFAESNPVTGIDKSSSSTRYPSSGAQPGQTYGAASGQQQSPQSSRIFGPAAGSSESSYYMSKQGPEAYGPGKSTGSSGGAAPSQSKYQSSSINQIPIIRLDTKNDGDGTYSTAYETGNGIQAEEQGQTQGDNTVAQGSYSYTSPEGEKVGISYTADEDGYHPQGKHLPTPPPVPEAILKSLEYNKAHPEEENDDGSYREDSEDESGGQYNSPLNKSQYSGSSNKYLAPISGSGASSQFSGSTSSPFVKGNSGSLPVNAPSSSQASFSSSNYPGSSVNNEDKSGSPVSGPAYNAQPSQQIGNKPSSGPSVYPSSTFGNTESGRAFPGSSFGNFKDSKPDKSSFPSHFGSNLPLNDASGPKPGSFFTQGAIAPQGGSPGQYGPQDSAIVQSNAPVGNNNKESAGPSNVNIPQRVPTSQFSSHASINGQFNKPSGSSSSPPYPSAPYGNAPGQSAYQSSNNGPLETSNVPQDSEGARFGPGSTTKQEFTQYQNLPEAQGEQNAQSSFSSGPSAAKPTQFGGNLPRAQGTQSSYYSSQNAVKPTQYSGILPSGPQGQQTAQSQFSAGPTATKSSQSNGYQYNAPNTPFRSSGQANLQQVDTPETRTPAGPSQFSANLPGQGHQHAQSPFSVGPTATKSAQFSGSLPGPQGKQQAQSPFSSGPGTSKSSQFSGNFPGAQGKQDAQLPFSVGPTATKSTQFIGSLPGPQGQQQAQSPFSSGPGTSKSTQFSGQFPGAQGKQDAQSPFLVGPTATKSTQYSGSLPGPQGQQQAQSPFSSGPGTSKSTQFSGHFPGAQGKQDAQSPFSVGPTATKSTQFSESLPGPQGQQQAQSPFSSGPGTSKSSQFSGNFPGAQGKQDDQSPFSVGPTTTKSTKFSGTLPGPQGQQQGQSPFSFGPNASKSTQFSGHFPGDQGKQDAQSPFSVGPTATKSTQFSGSLSEPQGQPKSQSPFATGPTATKSSQSNGYQYNAPNTPFRSSGQSNFQQVGTPETRTPVGSFNSKVGSEFGPSKVVGEFADGETRSYSGPPRTPGVQAQDENGGYLY